MPFSQQSPINLTNPIYADLGAEGLQLVSYEEVKGLVVKEKEEVKLQFPPGNGQSIVLGGKEYQLDSLHFHRYSEHLIDEKRFDMELHIVHKNEEDGLCVAVIAVLIEMSREAPPHPKLDKLLNSVAKILYRPSEDYEGRHVLVRPRDLLPRPEEEYYRYEGSLTTPDYPENVSWVVMKNPFLVNSEELGDLIHEFKKPARDVMPMNRRFLLATFRPEESQPSAQKSIASAKPKRKSASRPKASK